MTKPRLIADSANLNSISGDRIEDLSIEGSKFAEGSINGNRIEDLSIEGSKLAEGSIGESKLTQIPSGKIDFSRDEVGAVTRSAENKMRDWVSITDFGAIEGNDQANAAANKTAIEAALAASQTVYVPPGFYITDGNILLKGKTIFGAGARASYIKLSGLNTNESLFVTDADGTSGWGQGGGLTMYDLGVVGNWDGRGGNGTTAPFNDAPALIKWYAGAQIRVSKCFFASSNGSAIAIQRGGYMFFFQNKISTHRYEGIWLDAFSGSESITSTWIQECDINSCRGVGGAIRFRNTLGVYVTECILEDINNGLYVEGNDNRNVTMQRCHIEQAYVAGIHVIGSGLLFNFSDNFLGVSTPIIKTNPQFQTGIISNNFGDDSSQFKQLKPIQDNFYTLGTLSQRWSEVYAVNGTINTSDKREKNNIGEINATVLKAWAKVDFKQFKMNDNDDWHFGVIAQDVVKAFESEGLDPEEYSIIVEQTWEENGETKSRYGLNYNQALALECALLRSKLV